MHLGGAIAVMCLSIVPTAVSDPSLSLLNSSGLPVAPVTAGLLTLVEGSCYSMTYSYYTVEPVEVKAEITQLTKKVRVHQLERAGSDWGTNRS